MYEGYARETAGQDCQENAPTFTCPVDTVVEKVLKSKKSFVVWKATYKNRNLALHATSYVQQAWTQLVLAGIVYCSSLGTITND